MRLARAACYKRIVMKNILLLSALLLVSGVFAEEFPRELKVDENANAEMQKFIGAYSVEAFSAKENGLPIEAKAFNLVKIELAKSRNPKLPAETSYDLDLYVNLDAHTRWEMWSHDATTGGDEGLAREGVLIRLEKIKGHPAWWKKVSYSAVNGEQIITTDVFSFEKVENILFYKQKRTVLTFDLNQNAKMGKIAPAKRRSYEYVYTLKKL